MSKLGYFFPLGEEIVRKVYAVFDIEKEKVRQVWWNEVDCRVGSLTVIVWYIWQFTLLSIVTLPPIFAIIQAISVVW